MLPKGLLPPSPSLFLGPYIEISVLVPDGKGAEAVTVIKKYMDSNMLTVNLRT